MKPFSPYILLVTLCFGLFPGHAQTIDPSRVTDWSKAGFQGDRQPDFAVYDFTQHGGVADGITPNDAALQDLLGSLNGGAAVIYFPQGQYLFNQTISLRSNLILRGEGAAETELRFNLGGSGNLIAANGSVSGTPVTLAANAAKDDGLIILDGAAGFGPGDALQLIEEDDSLITSDWALYTTGQIVRVSAVSGDTLFLETPLRRGYRVAAQARAVRLNMQRIIGVEKLRIVREDATVSQTSNIRFDLVADSWIQCVESYNSNFGHIDLRRSMHVTVEGSYMQDGFAYGSGGKAYGVVLHSTTGDCLVTGNRFKHLRHSMLLQSGANGNVLSYNYSTDPHWTEVGPLPANSAGDLVLHGNYPYLNLFEGNDVAHIVIDDSHGANGPFNTVFRNRAHLYGIFLSNLPPSPQQNLIGNEVTNPNAIMGYYVINGWGHFEYGNNIRGQIIPAGTASLSEASLYLNEAPAYYTDNGSWPPLGPPNAINQHTIEARDLYVQGHLTDCGPGVISGTVTGLKERCISAYPSPTNGPVRLDWEAGPAPVAVRVFNLAGKQVKVSAPDRDLDLTGLPAGLYYVRLSFTDGSQGTVAIAVLSKN